MKMTSASELTLQVVVDPGIDQPVNAVVLGKTRPGEGSIVYEGLAPFYDDLIQGRALPLTLAVPYLRDVSDAVLVAFFLRRDLVILPKAADLVMAASLASRGPAGLAHVDPDLGVYFRFLSEYVVMPFERMSPRERGRRMGDLVERLEDFLVNDRLPTLEKLRFPEPRILDVGTNGFVVAEQNTPDLWWGWVSLYRQGYLRGVLFQEDHFLAARKSPHLSLDLRKASKILREAGVGTNLYEDALWLEGTCLREAVLRVLTVT